MLQTKTKEQRKIINDLFLNPKIHADEEDNNGLVVGKEWISYEQMAAIVDYLRKENDIYIPTICSISTGHYGTLYDLSKTPHNEVMEFCKRLAWVKGRDFSHWYDQYVKSGKILIN